MGETSAKIFALVGFSLFSQALSAQEAPAKPDAAAGREFLTNFVGDWDLVSEGSGMKGEAMMNSSMPGKLWLVNSSDHKVGDTKMESVQMIGYDPNKKKYVVVGADSMVNHMWHDEGTVDESCKKLTLDAQRLAFPAMEK